MDERVMQFRVGVMFLATFLIVGILLVMFGKLPKFIGTYPIQVRFKYAAGVTNYTPVRKSGILIGRVSDVQLTDNDSNVLITADIQSDKKIYENETCYITRDLLGDTAMVFTPSEKKGRARKQVTPGMVIDGEISDDPTGLKRVLETPINTVRETGESLKEASDELRKAAKNVNSILDTERQNIHDVLANTAEALKAIRAVLGDEQTQAKLAEALKKLPETFDCMNDTFRSVDANFKKFTKPGDDGKSPIDRMLHTVEMTEKALRKFSEAPRDGGPPPVDQLVKTMENVNEITRLMRSILDRIDRGDGTVGALMNDRQLYDRLNHAAKNMEEISYQIRPILDDARVFSDKVARHPGVIVRDAVKPGIGIK
jgi:phospholipid/cholesterol/gamma-HCH transport system substrate-binding protein